MRMLCCLSLVVFIVPLLRAEELTLENVTRPAANTPDEPLAKDFSLQSAVRFLDQASLDWTKTRKCFTCHTNYAYLMVRPAVSFDAVAHRQVREALEELVESGWQEQGPRWDAEVVMSAAALAVNDAATTGELHPATRKALDRMWTVQRADGGFNWLKCGWPPMESDDEFGAAMALIAAGAAPGGYAQTPAAQQGLQKLRAFLANNPPPTLHHTAMLIWADSYLGGWVSREDREAGVAKLLQLQGPDGGWALAGLGDWRRGDGKEQDLATSDGYGTGFVLFVLRRAGLASDDPRLQRGVAWLKANQRVSGRWHTRSLNKDNKHFLSHAGSAFAVLVLCDCEPPLAQD